MYYDETEKRAHDSQIVRAEENLKLSHGGPSYGQSLIKQDKQRFQLPIEPESSYCHAFDMIYLAGRNDATIQLSQLCGVTWLCHQYPGSCSC